MLLSFSVANFKSFREEQVLDLTATALKPAFSWLAHAAVPVGKEASALRVKAIYGANASGKSNLLEALHRMLIFGLTSASTPGILAGLDPFTFDSTTRGQPSRFELEFVVDARRYRYGFLVDRNVFHEEWLYDETVRKAKVYVRKGQEVSTGKKYFTDSETVALLQRGDNKLFREDASFLSALSLFNPGGAVGKVIGFLFSIGVIGNTEELGVEQMAYQMLADKDMRDRVSQLLASAGIEFENLFVMDKEVLKDSSVPPEVVTAIRNSRGRYSLVASYGDEHGENHAGWLTERGESQGTQKLLVLAPYIVQTIQRGGILVVDEFESKLHTRLSREIVAMFNSATGNPHGAQFIFSTHDTNLLDHRLLRRDQIDFVEKNEERASTIYSLADVKGIRKEADFESDYLGGSYGAVPEVTDFNIAILEE